MHEYFSSCKTIGHSDSIKKGRWVDKLDNRDMKPPLPTSGCEKIAVSESVSDCSSDQDEPHRSFQKWAAAAQKRPLSRWQHNKAVAEDSSTSLECSCTRRTCVTPAPIHSVASDSACWELCPPPFLWHGTNKKQKLRPHVLIHPAFVGAKKDFSKQGIDVGHL